MRKSIIISALLLGGLFSLSAQADTLQMQQNAPDRYVVVKGDTLWDISARFLKTPWKWPEIWNMNKEEIKNPHWIYPGDVIVLDHDAAGNPSLRILPQESGSDLAGSKLAPRIRVTPLDKAPISALPLSVIGPFLSKPLVIEPGQLAKSPRLVAGPDGRVIISSGDKAYAVGFDRIGATPGSKWQVYRPGKNLPDPESKDGKGSLGVEAVYLGDAELLKVDDVSTLKIAGAVQEVLVGDRLVPLDDSSPHSYLPHSPKHDVRGVIISSFNGVEESGQYYVVVINRGSKDGLERGHVLQAYKQGRATAKEDPKEPNRVTPAEQYADLMLFRVFDRVSYALIMRAEDSVHVGDVVRQP